MKSSDLTKIKQKRKLWELVYLARIRGMGGGENRKIMRVHVERGNSVQRRDAARSAQAH